MTCFRETICILIARLLEMLRPQTLQVESLCGSLKTFLEFAHQTAASNHETGNLVEKAFRQRGHVSSQLLEREAA